MPPIDPATGTEGKEIGSTPFQEAYQSTPEELAQLENNFTYHKPFGDQPQRFVVIRDQAKGLALTILRFSPKCRERSLALTKLEEVVMWANAGIARNEKE